MIRRDDTKLDILKAEKGIRTDTQLAKELGITTSNLSNRLSGSLSNGTLYLLSKYFDVTPNELLKDKRN